MKEVSSRTAQKLKKRMKIIKKYIFINSLGLYLSSLLAVKVLIIAWKLVVSFVFNIDPGLHGLRIFGLNPPESPVWNKASVLLYFSGEVMVPLVLISAVLTGMFFYQKLRTIWKAAILWFGFSSFQCLFGGILAGIAARTNQYYIFSWLGMSNYQMIVIAIIMLPALLATGTFYNSFFMIIKPHHGFGSSTTENRKVLIYGVLLPVLAGTVILSAVLITAFGKYELIELISGILLALPLLFFIGITNPQRNSTGYSSIFYKLSLVAGLTASLFFLISNILFGS